MRGVRTLVAGVVRQQGGRRGAGGANAAGVSSSLVAGVVLVSTASQRAHFSSSAAPTAASAQGASAGAAEGAGGKPAAPAGAKEPLSPALSDKYDYDVVVIGGGSGGLACVREVASSGGKSALFDFVVPSPQGTKWGIGGTCVNVGCIPKKLMHQAALLGRGIHDAEEYGWGLKSTPAGDGAGATLSASVAHSWPSLSANIQDYIRGTNWGYRNALRDERVEYIPALARVTGPHTVEWTERGRWGKPGAERSLTAAHIVVAVGGRPRYPGNVPGASELGITSDDLFWLEQAPGKTLLVGGGYVALECAGFLGELGGPTPTVMVRGPALRGFDVQMAEKIVEHMQTAVGIRFLRDTAPVRLEAVDGPPGPNGKPRVRVVYRTTTTAAAAAAAAAEGGDARAASKVVETSEEFDTVIFATGRAPETGRMNLAAVGVAMDAGGKIVGGLGRLGDAAVAPASASAGPAPAASAPAASAGAPRRSVVTSVWSETTTVPSIHAVGDVLAGRPELTPVAIRAGKLLAQRIMRGIIPLDATQESVKGVDPLQAPRKGSSASRAVMDYALVPTTVFTPLEYGCVGLSEEEAVSIHGGDGAVEVYHLQYDTLELSAAHRKDKDGAPLAPQCYAKMVCVRDGPASKGPAAEKVVGLHVLGPHAGEVIQGFAVALRGGATREDFLSTVGIHPTHAEELVTLHKSKRAGGSAVKTSC